MLQKEREKLGWNGGEVNKHLGKALPEVNIRHYCIKCQTKRTQGLPNKKRLVKASRSYETSKYEDVVYKFNIQMGLTDVWDDINFYDRSLKNTFNSKTYKFN